MLYVNINSGYPITPHSHFCLAYRHALLKIDCFYFRFLPRPNTPVDAKGLSEELDLTGVISCTTHIHACQSVMPSYLSYLIWSVLYFCVGLCLKKKGILLWKKNWVYLTLSNFVCARGYE